MTSRLTKRGSCEEHVFFVSDTRLVIFASRLNTEESIQMFTALALLLVQSVIELPTTPTIGSFTAITAASGDNNTQPKLESGGSQHQPEMKAENNNGLDQNAATDVKLDDEVLVISSYKTALITAHKFLSVFLRK